MPFFSSASLSLSELQNSTSPGNTKNRVFHSTAILNTFITAYFKTNSMGTTKLPFQEIKKANEYDSSVFLNAALEKGMAARYLAPEPYSKTKLFENMAKNRIAVYTGYPMRMLKQYDEEKSNTLLRNLSAGLPAREKVNIRTGPSRTVKRVMISEIIKKWKLQRSRFGVTDLHFRGTKFFKTVDAKAISYFNLLPLCPDEVSFLEMMTLVISARGIFSDSHSDDGDGSNHCFVGKKLWLAWDRAEGKQYGLQDCTYDDVYSKAKFSMHAFVSMKSARWFIISDNCTLFMPGNFAHKVITLEPYIGFGSFYVTLPGYINTLKRWLLYPTSDVKVNFIEILNKYTIKKIKQLARSSPAMQKEMGLSYLKRAVAQWKTGLNKKEREVLLSNKSFADLLAFAG